MGEARYTRDDLDAAYAEGFAAQRDVEAVLVLRRVLEYVGRDASVYTNRSRLGRGAHAGSPVGAYLNEDLIPWLQARIAEASS